MWALGEALIYLIYLLLALWLVIFLVLAVVSKKSRKPFMALCALFGLLLIGFRACHYKSHKNDQQNQVGIYYLTKYHNCSACYIELKDDMTYLIVRNGQTIKRGTWHHESGGDYWITYLDGKKHQLGSGDFHYSDYTLKNETK